MQNKYIEQVILKLPNISIDNINNAIVPIVNDIDNTKLFGRIHLNDIISHGPTGPTGVSGQSITGPTGLKGATGASGLSITGPTGLKGATGASGLSITGPTGLKGATGANGLSITGPTGVSGQSITGPTGPSSTLDILLHYTNPTNLTSIAYDATAPTPSISTKYKFSTSGICQFISSGKLYVEVGDELCVLNIDSVYTYIYIENPIHNMSVSNEISPSEHLIQTDIISKLGAVNYTTGGISTSTMFDVYFGFCKGDILEISMPTSTNASTSFGIAFYSSSGNYLYGYKLNYTSSYTREICTFYLRDTVCYFKASYFTTTQIPTYGEFYAKLYTKKYIPYILDNREICDGNDINVTSTEGTLYTSTTLGCTSYIHCLGVKKIILTMPVLTTTAVQGLAFYDSTKTVISGYGILRPVGSASGISTITITRDNIPNNAVFFRTTFWNFANSLLYGEFLCTLYYEDGFLGSNKYFKFQDGQIHFQVKVNQSVSNFWNSGSTNQEPESFKGSTAVMILPDSYSETGTPTKIIMYCHGMSRNVSYTQWSGNDVTALAQKEYWRSQGVAVFDCNGPHNNGGEYLYANGAPQSVDAYRKSFEYIIQHYNIDPEIYVVAGSMGGLVGLNYCYTYNNVRALALLSAWTSNYYCGWGQNVKTPYTEFYGFTDTTTYESEKVSGWDPWSRILTINNFSMLYYNKHAVKLWIGSLESASVLYDYSIGYMSALRNANSDASYRIVDGADHSLVSGGSTVVNQEVITWLYKH